MDHVEASRNKKARRAARQSQAAVELRRLIDHQHIGIELLSAVAKEQARALNAANREIDRWEVRQLCSQDYIDRWREWLALPMPELVKVMCSDAKGWGSAMRQNSPFVAQSRGDKRGSCGPLAGA